MGEILHTRDLFRGSRHEIAHTRALEATVAALPTYEPHPYAGRVGLILGERFDETSGTLSWSHWNTLCTGLLKVERIAGTSTGIMFRAPHVVALASRIQSICGPNSKGAER